MQIRFGDQAPAEGKFYLQMIVLERWSKREQLERKIDDGLSV